MGSENYLDEANKELLAMNPGIDKLDEFSLNDLETVKKYGMYSLDGIATLGTIAFMRFREISKQASDEIDEILEAVDDKNRYFYTPEMRALVRTFYKEVFADPDKYGVPQDVRGNKNYCYAWTWINLEKLPGDGAALSIARKRKGVAVWAWCEVFKRLRNEREAAVLQ